MLPLWLSSEECDNFSDTRCPGVGKVGMQVQRVKLDHRHCRAGCPDNVGVHGVADVQGPVRVGSECFQSRREDPRLWFCDLECSRIGNCRNVGEGPSPTWQMPNRRICASAVPSLFVTIATGIPEAPSFLNAAMLSSRNKRQIG